MYYIQNNTQLTIESVSELFTQEQIFSIVFGKSVDFNSKICSPLRKDSFPGCYFEYYNGKLWFIDFATTKVRWDCFELIKDYYNLNLVDSLKLIYYTLISDKSEFKSNIQNNFSKTSKTKSSFDILYKCRSFNNKDKDYWFPYGITRKQLIEDKVFPIHWFKTQNFYKGDFLIRPFNISFIFTDFESGHKKVYSPLDTKNKWFTNCNELDIGNIKNIPKLGENLIITKSYKDCRVIRNCGIPSIWLQNEVVIPKNNKALFEVLLRFTNIYTLFDNDYTGINFTNNFTLYCKGQYNIEVKNLFMPKELGKDPSEVQKKKQNLKEILTLKI